MGPLVPYLQLSGDRQQTIPHLAAAKRNYADEIQDEVAFQKLGPMVLSMNAPKEIVDVEAACQGLLDRAE